MELSNKLCLHSSLLSVLTLIIKIILKINYLQIIKLITIDFYIDSLSTETNLLYFFLQYLHVRHECNCPPLPKEDPRHKLHAIRTSVDNLLTSRKARANIERFKIPMKNHNEQYIAMSALDNFKKRETDIKITILPSAMKLQELENEEKGKKKSKNKEVVKTDVKQQ